MKGLDTYVALTQIVGAVFVLYSILVTMLNSTMGAPGGSLTDVLTAQPILRLPTAVLGGLFLGLVLVSLVMYALKRQNE